jgi:hypothetical protein
MSRKKHALGLDPMGGNRFSDKEMRNSKDLERIALQRNRDAI